MRNNDDLAASGAEQLPDAEDSGRLAAFNQYRGLLFSIAYRMVGSVADAEDLVQDTFIRWQQASDSEIRSAKAFLITILSRLSINHLQSARVQREEYVGEWLPEPLATEPGSNPLGVLRADESLSMAFLVMLERLAPVERAVFLLREVFDYKYAEIAAALGLSEANSRQILRRAHAARVILAQRAKRELQPFSFSTLAQAVAIGRLGVIYLLNPDDRQIGYIIKGRTARRLRDFFLLLVVYGFKLERRFPGSFFLPGRNRVSWRQANDAMQEFKAAQKI